MIALLATKEMNLMPTSGNDSDSDDSDNEV